MTKSIVNIIFGVLVHQNKAKLTDLIKAPEWKEANDRRNTITMDIALRMSTGLEFDESYNGVTDVTLMLFNRYLHILFSSSAGKYGANKKLLHPIDTHWMYSSGTSNIIGRKIKDYFRTYEEYWKFARENLFDVLGIDQSGVYEVDKSGHWIASSFSYFTSRDWAKFAQLYLNDGVWNGKRILPEGWAKYTSTPTPGSRDRYGSHWWIYKNFESYGMSGFEGQFTIVNPKNNIVIVRNGLTRVSFDFERFFIEILNSIVNL
jgi:CubicO group peptidase (beta-lactamase class C family)